MDGKLYQACPWTFLKVPERRDMLTHERERDQVPPREVAPGAVGVVASQAWPSAATRLN